MSLQEPTIHYVCTWDQAEDILREHDRFWVSACGCREGKGKCERSRMEICLMFKGDISGSGGTGTREISRADVNDILRETKEVRLVTRPFRNDNDRTETEGICFCCDDCCGYFRNPEERCDKGTLIEETEMADCNDCGLCEDVCHFGARQMVHDKLAVDRDFCYGCGLCVVVCPEECVEMVARS
jgi:Pyruvate/2-oxoacid:ferredoxin oxidoreductase delta subunit